MFPANKDGKGEHPQKTPTSKRDRSAIQSKLEMESPSNTPSQNKRTSNSRFSDPLWGVIVIPVLLMLVASFSIVYWIRLLLLLIAALFSAVAVWRSEWGRTSVRHRWLGMVACVGVYLLAFAVVRYLEYRTTAKLNLYVSDHYRIPMADLGPTRVRRRMSM